jgi:hypothetical protein
VIPVQPLRQPQVFGNVRFGQPEEGVDYGHLKKDAPSIPAATVKEKAPTEAVARQRRAQALKRLEQIKTAADQFDCPFSITSFNLDNALEKYKTDQPPNKFLEWYDYAMPDISRRDAFQKVLRIFRDGPIYDPAPARAKFYPLAQNVLSKVHYILTEKQARINQLPPDQKFNAEDALKQQVRHIITRLLDTENDCIDQLLSQLEGIASEVVSTENPLNKESSVALLQYKAAFLLFKYRTDMIQKILLSDPALESEQAAPHMADIEREVKKNIAGAMEIKAEIINIGAGFNAVRGLPEQMRKATERALPLFLDQDKPTEYFEQCRFPWSDVSPSQNTPSISLLRNDLLEWATTYYGLNGEDELSKAVAEDQEALESLLGIESVSLTLPGIQLFLEAVGIFQKIEGKK